MSNNRETAELRKIQSEIKRLAEQQERTADQLEKIVYIMETESEDFVTPDKSP